MKFILEHFKCDQSQILLVFFIIFYALFLQCISTHNLSLFELEFSTIQLNRTKHQSEMKSN